MKKSSHSRKRKPRKRKNYRKKRASSTPKYKLFFLGLAVGVILSIVLLTRCAVRGKVLEVPSRGAPSAVVSSEGLEIPRVDNPEFLIACPEGRYTLWYDTLYRQAAWVAHRLTRSDLQNTEAKRKNRFIVCAQVRAKGWPYAVDKDYSNSGYDRGHLVPSADRVVSQAENDATFRLSNIAPQTPRLNRVLWNNLESEVRRMAHRLDTLWVVTGGELKPGLERIGTNGVGVPERFFKVLLARKNNQYIAIGFVIPNTQQLNGTFWDYAVSVDEVEKLSGIDFFPNLPDALEKQVEAECRPERWK